MNHSKSFAPGQRAADQVCVRPKRFVFLDKKSGARRFAVRPAENGGMPLDEAASLIAIHCLARQQSPRDFHVMVEADEDLFEGLLLRATKLIRTFSGCRAPHPLSRRQRDVMNCVRRNLSNKEIGSELNISERTVKFHVSALLEKFGVRNRVELMFKAAEVDSTERLLPSYHRPRAAARIGIARPTVHRVEHAITHPAQTAAPLAAMRQSASR